MDFRKKLLILTVSAMGFAGVSYGQVTQACGTATNKTGPPNLLRIEGTTELVSDEVISCTGNTVPAAPNGQLILNIGLNVTSKTVGSGLAAINEASLQLTSGGAGAGGTGAGSTTALYQGSVSGSSVTFGTSASPVAFPTTAYTMVLSNIRVNASTGALNTYVSQSLLATNQGVVIFTQAPVNVGYIQQGFAAAALTGGVAGGNPVNYVICTANPAAAPTSSFQVTIKELFGGAFKSNTPTAGGTCGGAPCTPTNGEQGSLYVGVTTPPDAVTPPAVIPAGVGTAIAGTRFVFNFAAIPTGVTIYMPTVVNVVNPSNTLVVTNAPLTFTMTASATGAFSAVAASIPPGSTLPAGSVALTSANGAATAVYEVTSTDNTLLAESANFIGYVTASAGFASSAQPAITVTVTPAPTGTLPTTYVPLFASQTPTPLNLSAFGVCTTSLLFPFVTNQLGFDTGIVLSNTSTDAFGKVGAVPAPGTCALNFFGVGAPTNPVAAPGGSQASGTTNAFQLSSVAPGFQGYMISTCNYLFGHGYAFIEYNLTQGNGVAEGYLPLVIGGARGQAPSESLTE